MEAEQRAHLEKLRQADRERLMELEISRARFGYSAPPEIVTEIRHIESHIREIDQELQAGQQAPVLGSSTVTILFVAADPSNATSLRLGEEFREIQERLQIADLRNCFNLVVRMATRPEDFLLALRDESPQLVHFSGHGTEAGELCFENDDGKVQPVTAEALKHVFRKFAHQVKCIVLNACYAEIQANAIAEYIDYVVGMRGEIGDKAAIAFVSGFYRALGRGMGYADAYEFGCLQMEMMNIPAELTPVLIPRRAVDLTATA